MMHCAGAPTSRSTFSDFAPALFSACTLRRPRHDDLDSSFTTGILAAVRECLQPEAAGGDHLETPCKSSDTAGVCHSGVLSAGIHRRDAIGRRRVHGPACRRRASRRLPTSIERHNNQHAWLAMQPIASWRLRPGIRLHRSIRCIIKGINRKLQPAPFRVLARKTRTIKDELGSFTDVISSRLKTGIEREQAARIAEEFDSLSDAEKDSIREEELEADRLRGDDLKKDIARLERIVHESAKQLHFDAPMLRDAISCSLEMLGAKPLREEKPGRFVLPNLDTQRGADPTWVSTLDTLRSLPRDGRRDFAWRRESSIRPVVFEAPEGIDDSSVQLHLSHRLVQRLLGRFTAQGFVYDDLSRACFATSDDTVPRVVLLGRLAVYGPRASRLHEEILTVTARWLPLDQRKGPLSLYGRDGEQRTMQVLRQNLGSDALREPPAEVLSRLAEALPRDIEELLSHLQPRAEETMADAVRQLAARGEAEAGELIKLLEDQRRRVNENLRKYRDNTSQMTLGFDDDQLRQMDSDARRWEHWLANVEGDLQREPARIREFYTVKSHRIEPVGLVYLWPV